MNLTEQQRLDAIASCERIEKINAQMQTNLKNILRILDNCANGRGPEDGIEEPIDCTCDCCGLKFQRSCMLLTKTSTGLETFACDGCRS